MAQVIVNRRTGHLVDGHLRVEKALSHGQPTIPVLYVDLEPDEEALVLASLDPLAAMAETDAYDEAGRTSWFRESTAGQWEKMRYVLTPDAIDLGLDAALPAELEVGAQMNGFGRGERGRASLTHLAARARPRPPLVMQNLTRPPRVWSADERKAG